MIFATCPRLYYRADIAKCYDFIILTHGRSFYRLAQYIEYKARFAGVKVMCIQSERILPAGIHHINEWRNYTFQRRLHIYIDAMDIRHIAGLLYTLG